MTKRDENRNRFPRNAEFVDMVRKVFPTAKVVYVRDGANEVGTPTPDVDYGATEYAMDVRRMRK